jgi:hypothetical protein
MHLFATTKGRVFLDHDPELIEIIVNFLRTKKVEDPSNQVVACHESREGKGKYSHVFYTLFLPLDIANIEVVQPIGSAVNLTKSEKKILQFSKNSGEDNFHFLACKPSIDTDKEFF